MNAPPEQSTTVLSDPDAEAAYLGMLLLACEAAPALVGQVVPGDFVRPQHRTIYEAVVAVVASGRVPDPALVMSELEARGQERYEVAEIIRLVNEAPTPARLQAFALTIRQAAVRRALHQLAQSLARTAAGAAPAPGALEAAVVRARRWLERIAERLDEPVVGLYPAADGFLPAVWPATPRSSTWRRAAVEIPE